ncbi:peroxidase [Endozoicomonas sp. OPT23]|uniref:redoxin domain-containing protein n=1 Tax=Endozoicomonas sp. OPT23 TaxID=2072845 RepID=UPI00129A1AA6|nr:redoxin domain-containing protein [Endozoicomonas sp. OPT23]MRI32522.1 peroxidase [Endozoicomonas sp. OPT23]
MIIRFVSRQIRCASVFAAILFGGISGYTTALQIGSEAPDFEMVIDGKVVKFHDHIKDKYAIFFSHPFDFTPVCTTELAEVHKRKPFYDDHQTVAVGLSVDSGDRHRKWSKDILKFASSRDQTLNFSLVSDEQLEVAKKYEMLANDEQPGSERSAGTNFTARTVFIIGKDKKIKLMMTYPMYIGRNFNEISRALLAQIEHDDRKIATPANWQPGDDVVVPPGMTTEDAEQKYGEVRVKELPSFSEEGIKHYLRFVNSNTPESEREHTEHTEL